MEEEYHLCYCLVKITETPNSFKSKRRIHFSNMESRVCFSRSTTRDEVDNFS